MIKIKSDFPYTDEIEFLFSIVLCKCYMYIQMNPIVLRFLFYLTSFNIRGVPRRCRRPCRKISSEVYALFKS